MDLEGASSDAWSRVATVSIGTDGAQVSAIGFYLVRALRVAAIARFVLMGWHDAHWDADAQQAIALESVFVETVARASSPEP